MCIRDRYYVHEGYAVKSAMASRLADALKRLFPYEQQPYRVKQDLALVKLFAEERPANQALATEFTQRVARLLEPKKERAAQAREELKHEEKALRRELAELYRQSDGLTQKIRYAEEKEGAASECMERAEQRVDELQARGRAVFETPHRPGQQRRSMSSLSEDLRAAERSVHKAADVRDRAAVMHRSGCAKMGQVTEDISEMEHRFTILRQNVAQVELAEVHIAAVSEASSTLVVASGGDKIEYPGCLLYTSPSPRDRTRSRMPSSA
eukprot:TRINITY_DN6419_c0_g1_i1.p1 TRINITY_DN6419_c0_g1~~TRINITY_DN6419_c0_g1_i1.p1  ORF type:complete len:267 (+),score=91.92 TRINITY_DN6419_c0_g1_i1:148-948(+)